MLSKSSSLRSQQTTTKELIPSITASANTLATQHQHGTQEPHWQILAAFSMNSATIGGAENAGIEVAVKNEAEVNTLIKRLHIVSLCISLFACKRSEMEFLAVHFA